ncbi:hypothetical protein Hdeb2414_s0044g00743101 [Helianthus debilis subsp. tardiflorus]
MMDVFRWSLCKKPLPQTLMCSIGIPLLPEHLKVISQSGWHASVMLHTTLYLWCRGFYLWRSHRYHRSDVIVIGRLVL